MTYFVITILAFGLFWTIKSKGDLKIKMKSLEAKRDEQNGMHAKLNAELETVKKSFQDATTAIEKLETYHAETEKYLPLIAKYQKIEQAESDLKILEKQHQVLKGTHTELVKSIDVLETHREIKESGFFSYKYKFEDILQYKEALLIVKDFQKKLISKKEVVVCSVAELEKSPIITGLRRLALRCFNLEFNLIMDRLTYANFDSCKEKLIDCFDTMNEELSVFNCEMKKPYFESKLKEMAIGLEYELEIQRIREEQVALKEQMRDEEEARVEAEETREKAIEEEALYEDALEKARKEVKAASAEEQVEMQAKIAELEAKLKLAHEERERATSLAQITRKGHVYIISNIGSFGENVFKIGLTRREDPMERVKELGDASVPFKFDVHAVIPSEDAPALENNLHQTLDSFRMNRVNMRKEFFRVPLEKIESTCKDLGCKIQLTQLAEAREYRETLEINQGKKVG